MQVAFAMSEGATPLGENACRFLMLSVYIRPYSVPHNLEVEEHRSWAVKAKSDSDATKLRSGKDAVTLTYTTNLSAISHVTNQTWLCGLPESRYCGLPRHSASYRLMTPRY